MTMPKSFRTHTIASIKRMAEDMLLRGMAVRTIDSYTYHVSSFSKRFGKLPEDLGPEQIRECQQTKATSRSPGKPTLVDNQKLSAEFSKRFLRKLKSLHRRDKLEIEGELAGLQEQLAWAKFTETLLEHDWCVFIQRPPASESSPEHVLKYLARYMTGGPISDRRLVSC